MQETVLNPLESVRRKVRLLILLSAARNAGLVPLPASRLHILAYLADVLSPVWNLDPYDGKVLKRPDGPFFPELQHDLDRLVGTGMATVTDVGHVSIGQERLRVSSSYSINTDLSSDVLQYIEETPDEAVAAEFLRELMLAMSAMSDEDIDRAFLQDATYSNKKAGSGTVIDFAEWTDTNFSALAADRIGQLVPTNAEVGPSEKVHLYFRHLQRRLHGGR
ncbi:hypothetical protein [Sphingopyxis fribergensis]